MLLFVYGTLLHGEDNHAELRDAPFVCAATTEPRYELVDMGGYPALVEGGETAVAGEVYELTEEILRALDQFEEVPELYQRKTIRLGELWAETYVMRRETAVNARPLRTGDWRRR